MPPVKLPRATLEQKIEILDFYHQSNRPQLETVDRYRNEILISTSSFSEWLKNEDDLRARFNQASSSFSKLSRRKVKFKYEKINRAMDLLVQQKLERGEPINEPILREHWSIYAHQYGVEDPKRLVGFSHGWLSQFKKRHGLNKKRMGGEPSPPASDAALEPPAPAQAREVFDGAYAENNTAPSEDSNEDFSAAATGGASYDLMNPPTGAQFRQGVGYNANMGFNYGLYQQPDQQFDYALLRSQIAKQRQAHQTSQAQVVPPSQPRGSARASARAGRGAMPDADAAIDALDIERFIYMFVDRFFHDHAFEYPQTVKVFQEFKTAFFNERMLNIRSVQQQMVQASQPAGGIDDFFLRGSASGPEPKNGAKLGDKRWKK